jgi:putative hydroxymethylpyrimidine transport system permease protein
MNMALRAVVLTIGLIIFWQLVVLFFSLPAFILPGPFIVFKALITFKMLLFSQLLITASETIVGLILGIVIGCMTAFLMIFFKRFAFWFFPLLVISQAIPTFAIAPLLVVWFGYGMTTKIITTILMLFFPITSSFYDGLKRTDTGYLDLAKTMNAKSLNVFWHIRIPAALPSLASGIRVATAIAPIGAIIGEWVGASKGLGFLMLNSNERMQIDLMFAALFIIVLFSLSLYFCVDKCLKHLIFWQVEQP